MKLLSARVPDHPVWLTGLHSFAGWGNALAFERAGITPSSRAPDGGEIRRDASGQPTGILLNNAVRMMESAIPAPGDREMDARMLAALDAMARAGYTAVHDGNTDATMLASLQRLSLAGRLPIRVSVFLATSDSTLVRQWIQRGPDSATGSMLKVIGVKAFYDGALGSRGALLAADYSDMPGHRGRGGADIGFNESLLADAMARGFQIAIHAIGDAANTRVLDVYERIFRATPAGRNGRHRIEHVQVLAPADFPRFASLGIVASMQPGHAVEDKAWAEQRVGPERIKGAYAWRTLRNNGARLLFSSDMPGSSYNVFYMLHAAITRRDTELKPDGGWFPDERMTAEEAVRAFTSWAAWASFSERDAGSLTPGRRADITIIDRDPFTLGSGEASMLLSGSVVATIVSGRVAYEAGRGNGR
jgi:predicted amidohydrolase YtcJ